MLVVLEWSDSLFGFCMINLYYYFVVFFICILVFKLGCCVVFLLFVSNLEIWYIEDCYVFVWLKNDMYFFNENFYFMS